MTAPSPPLLDREVLREAIRGEYEVVAEDPNKGFHFHSGRPLARILGYQDAWLEGIPEASTESFAGTGNPFSLGEIGVGERVVDVGCGAGIDSLIAARMSGETGQVVGVDMTPAMLEKAKGSAAAAKLLNVEFPAPDMARACRFQTHGLTSSSPTAPSTSCPTR